MQDQDPGMRLRLGGSGRHLGSQEVEQGFGCLASQDFKCSTTMILLFHRSACLKLVTINSGR
jgi:hypothetical protein